MTKGRYARLCILVPLRKSLPKNVMIGKYLQDIHYEDTNPLCTICGCLGHNLYQCSNKNPTSTKTEEKSTTDTATGQWKTMSYTNKRCFITTLDSHKLEKEITEKEKIEKETKNEKQEGKNLVEKNRRKIKRISKRKRTKI